MAPSILIVKLSSMGDVIHTLPAAAAIRRALPRAKIGWAIERAHADLVRDHPMIDHVIEWDRGSARGLLEFVRQIRRHHWDVAIDFQGLLRSGVVAFLSGARRRIGYRPTGERAHWFYTERIPRVTMDRHAVERNLALAARLEGVSIDEPLDRPYLRGAAPAAGLSSPSRFPVHLGDEEQLAVDAWLARQGFDRETHRLVAFCPDCRKEANRWLAERFAELARRLTQRPEIRVVICGGPASRDVCAAAASESDANRVWRADGQFGLRASMALLSRASVAVTGDTGPMHMAVAVGVRVVALFGPANPLRTGPYAEDAIVLRQTLDCAPCFARRCPLKYDPPRCMAELSVDAVEAAVLRQIGQASDPRGAPRRRRSA